jgi:hypothetical protein
LRSGSTAGRNVDLGSLVSLYPDADLADFDFAPLRRVVAYDSSIAQCICNCFVVQISFVNEACAEAFNAHNTETWAMVLSRTLCHGLMANTWLMLGRL